MQAGRASREGVLCRRLTISLVLAEGKRQKKFPGI